MKINANTIPIVVVSVTALFALAASAAVGLSKRIGKTKQTLVAFPAILVCFAATTLLSVFTLSQVYQELGRPIADIPEGSYAVESVTTLVRLHNSSGTITCDFTGHRVPSVGQTVYIGKGDGGTAIAFGK